jgi:hypothetical protein
MVLGKFAAGFGEGAHINADKAKHCIRVKVVEAFTSTYFEYVHL